MQTRILTNWQPDRAQAFDRQIMVMDHNLHYSELFQDLTLAELLEQAPANRITVSSGVDPAMNRQGTRGNLSGSLILQAIRRGRLSLAIRQPETVNPAYRALKEVIYHELKALLPDSGFERKLMTLVISSPGLEYPCQFNTAGRIHWQVRGRRSVMIYPPHEPFLSGETLENALISGHDDHRFVYEHWHDQFVENYQLSPGQALHWPFNRPYRMVNSDLLNVSLVTELWSSEERRIHNVNLGNAVLRRIGVRAPVQETRGTAYRGKKLIARTRSLVNRLANALGGLKKRTLLSKDAIPIDFVIALEAPDSIRNLNRVDLGRGQINL